MIVQLLLRQKANLDFCFNNNRHLPKVTAFLCCELSKVHAVLLYELSKVSFMYTNIGDSYTETKVMH